MVWVVTRAIGASAYGSWYGNSVLYLTVSRQLSPRQAVSPIHYMSPMASILGFRTATAYGCCARQPAVCAVLAAVVPGAPGRCSAARSVARPRFAGARGKPHTRCVEASVYGTRRLLQGDAHVRRDPQQRPRAEQEP